MNEVEQRIFDQMYRRSSGILRQIDQPTRDDIYVTSFHIDNNAGARALEVELGYNTLTRWHSCTPAPGQAAGWPIASSSGEAKWNFAFWLHESYKPVFGRNDAHQCLRTEWLKSIGCYYTDADREVDFNSTLALDGTAENRFWELVTELVLHLRAKDDIRQVFSRDLPVLVHEVHMDDSCVEPTKRANPEGQAEPFFTEWA